MSIQPFRDPEWLNNVIERGKQIILDHFKETFKRYRAMGKLILESGYRKGQWRSEYRNRALEEWGISQPTFSHIIRLGELSELEFINAVNNFASVHAWVNQEKQKALPQPLTPLPKGVYRTLVIDPPWNIKKILREVRPNQQLLLDYPVMTNEEIKALPIQTLADPNGCHIYLWVTQKMLPIGFELFDAWNVKYECVLTWVKNVGFTPYSWMYSTEHVLFGRVGSLELQKKGKRLDFNAKVREHSRKPEEFYDLVREVSPEPRLDMFAREEHEGFEAWGNEVNKF